jgi:hypothetical protein
LETVNFWMWNNNNSIISKKYRFRLRVNGWGQIINIYEKKQRTKYWTLKKSMFYNAPIWIGAIIWIWWFYFYLLPSVMKVWFKPLTSYISDSMKM